MTSNAQRFRDSAMPYLRDMRFTAPRAIGVALAGLLSLAIATLASSLGQPDRVVSDLVIRGQVLDLTLAGVPAAIVAAWLISPYAAAPATRLWRATAVMAILVVGITDVLASLYFTLPALGAPLDLTAWAWYPMAFLAVMGWGALVYGVPGLLVASLASLPCVAMMRALGRRWLPR
jgi:hypothetical protein